MPKIFLLFLLRKYYMSEERAIRKKYREFSRADGDEHISSEFAVLMLFRIIKEFEIRSILEIGLGIGSISGSILSVDNLKRNIFYAGTESNNYFLESLRKNLKLDFRRIQIYDSLLKISQSRKFDLIIIDGKDPQLQKVKDLISTNVIAIEGDRMPQFEILKQIFPESKFVHCISRKKNEGNKPFSSFNWQGGLKIFFIKPTLFQKVWWLREKIRTKITYCYRSIRRK